MGYQQGVIYRRTGPLSYECKLNGRIVRKHADQLRFRRVGDGEADERMNDRDQSDIDEPLTQQPFPVLPPPSIEQPPHAVSSPAPSPSNATATPASNPASVSKSTLQTSSAVTASLTSPAVAGSAVTSTSSSTAASSSNRSQTVSPAAVVPQRRVLSQRERHPPVRPYDKYL